jgi:hypothetical protein
LWRCSHDAFQRLHCFTFRSTIHLGTIFTGVLRKEVEVCFFSGECPIDLVPLLKSCFFPIVLHWHQKCHMSGFLFVCSPFLFFSWSVFLGIYQVVNLFKEPTFCSAFFPIVLISSPIIFLSSFLLWAEIVIFLALRDGCLGDQFSSFKKILTYS